MDAVAAAFEAVPREGFLPERERRRAGYDGPLPIGEGQTNSQPRTVADMLRLLEVAPGQRVLDVGSGSGWTTALLAHLVGPEGQVRRRRARAVAGRVRHGQPGRDRPALGAHRPGRRRACSGCRTTRRTTGSWSPPSRARLPQQLVDQLGDGGRLVIPVRGTMTLVTRDGDETRQTHHGSYRFVPLR